MAHRIYECEPSESPKSLFGHWKNDMLEKKGEIGNVPHLEQQEHFGRCFTISDQLHVSALDAPVLQPFSPNTSE